MKAPQIIKKKTLQKSDKINEVGRTIRDNVHPLNGDFKLTNTGSMAGMEFIFPVEWWLVSNVWNQFSEFTNNI